MPLWLQWTLIIAGLLAIATLIAFIVRQSRLLSLSRRRDDKNRAFREKRRQSMVESIQVIAMAVEEDQVEYSEACLRLKGLLDHVAPELLERSPYRIFREISDQLQHMPTHRARQATDTRFIEKMDQERLALEKQHADTIRRAATALRQHAF
ncbi:DUF2489 domain-containing protein [Marinobacter sp. M-5]|jgi:exopolyphosphatase/pppGpp-phosphohydrolase|uniref:DUF2489 domain-containing protein n=1 Tax=Marinobacter sp. M-5 TaxID=3081089 RepID=UPI00293CF10D|nr:DUF2489 domain-containing protein [Marinobacter sp. M-5]MDV3504080.1 DUF2489 domain-containing protein [Marinobacter sp. M-5]